MLGPCRILVRVYLQTLLSFTLPQRLVLGRAIVNIFLLVALAHARRGFRVWAPLLRADAINPFCGGLRATILSCNGHSASGTTVCKRAATTSSFGVQVVLPAPKGVYQLVNACLFADVASFG